MEASLPPDFDSLRPPCARLTTAHEAWRERVRAFVDRHIAPHLDDWNRAGTFPDALYGETARAGLLGLGFAEDVGGSGPGGGLYDRITMAEEMHRLGSGVVYADLATHWIALPPVVRAGSERLQREVVRPVLAGEHRVAFAVTEPEGGSDLSRLRTVASREGEGWRLNGAKTLISGVMRADSILVAARTDTAERGVSLFLVDAHGPGVSREPVEGLAWYNASIGTVRFEDAVLPADALIGDEGGGFRALAEQFNIERLSGVGAALGLARSAVAQALAFTRERETFGQRLVDHQVVRHRLVELAGRIRSAYSYLDACVEWLEAGDTAVADLALLKIEASAVLEHCAREALHLLGGSAYQGAPRLERIFRESRIFALGGGTPEVLRDLVARQWKF
ncbi:acyl-CoA dehydrogenase family protein [Elongatibacter sediminis]|uniref:Acyl-CoA dehydrogenase family protein n=1 Tax=Elongatibacter sediminis TaxID=3119006 RepID=A0AAW9RJT9_9GAMM